MYVGCFESALWGPIAACPPAQLISVDILARSPVWPSTLGGLLSSYIKFLFALLRCSGHQHQWSAQRFDIVREMTVSKRAVGGPPTAEVTVKKMRKVYKGEEVWDVVTDILKNNCDGDGRAQLLAAADVAAQAQTEEEQRQSKLVKVVSYMQKCAVLCTLPSRVATLHG